jgi:succinate dehydrogenase/fumarate reductase flavoprotein subunit
LAIAAQVDADMRNMNEAWWCPSTAFPDELIDGQQMFRLLLTERARPGSLMVDGGGKRFINESLNYNDAGRALMRLPGLRPDGVVAWLIFDSSYRKRYHVGTIRKDAPDPEWLVVAASLEEMEAELDLPPGRLEETIEEFNRGVLRGVDPRFQRGRSAYDKFVGDSANPHPSLGKVGTPPFYALPVIPGCLGTKGGPLTDQDGRVLSKGVPVPGLYAVGNTAANPLGTAYPGAGGTIGPHIVFGRRAGYSAAMNGR